MPMKKSNTTKKNSTRTSGMKAMKAMKGMKAMKRMSAMKKATKADKKDTQTQQEKSQDMYRFGRKRVRGGMHPRHPHPRNKKSVV
jgi:hypothetical protein